MLNKEISTLSCLVVEQQEFLNAKKSLEDLREYLDYYLIEGQIEFEDFLNQIDEGIKGHLSQSIIAIEEQRKKIQ